MRTRMLTHSMCWCQCSVNCRDYLLEKGVYCLLFGGRDSPHQKHIIQSEEWYTGGGGSKPNMKPNIETPIFP